MSCSAHISLLTLLGLALWNDPGHARLGQLAALLLLASLACTPATRWLGWRKALLWRRPLGLYCFGLACGHLLLFWTGSNTFLDNPSAWFGAVCFSILGALAATSTRASQRRLGRSWKKLHRLVYLAGACLCLHVALAGQVDLSVVAGIGLGYLLLMLLRARRS